MRGFVLTRRSTVGRVRRVSHASVRFPLQLRALAGAKFERCRGSRKEAYLKALRSFESFQPGTNFRAWMFQILRNTFLSSRSKLERRMTVAMDSEKGGPELAVDMETPETILMFRGNSQLVQRAIDDLPPHYRETLLLCEVEEMSYQEIAQILSIPTGTVMSRLARARKSVRQSLLGVTAAPLSKALSHSLDTH